MKINALVLAGGRIKDFKEGGHKAFLPLGNGIMLDRVLDALKESHSVGKIAITSIPRSVSFENNGFEIFPTKKDLIESIINSLENMPEKITLIAASDVPLVTSEMIDQFIDECLQTDADFYYPVIPKESVMKKFPTTKRTYFTVKEGVFTGGNIILINNDVFVKNKNLARRIYADRKKPFRLIKILGVRFLYRYFRKTLSLSEIEEKASQTLGSKAKAVIFPYPEIGTDVDKKSDYELMQALINNGTN